MKKIDTLHNNFFGKVTNFNLIFNVKILIDQNQTKSNKHLRLTIKFNPNVEIASRQLFGTPDTLYTALNNVRAYLFRFSANSLPQIVLNCLVY
jgi:hypothetical protein